MKRRFLVVLSAVVVGVLLLPFVPVAPKVDAAGVKEANAILDAVLMATVTGVGDPCIWDWECGNCEYCDQSTFQCVSECNECANCENVPGTGWQCVSECDPGEQCCEQGEWSGSCFECAPAYPCGCPDPPISDCSDWGGFRAYCDDATCPCDCKVKYYELQPSYRLPRECGTTYYMTEDQMEDGNLWNFDDDENEPCPQCWGDNPCSIFTPDECCWSFDVMQLKSDMTCNGGRIIKDLQVKHFVNGEPVIRMTCVTTFQQWANQGRVVGWDDDCTEHEKNFCQTVDMNRICGIWQGMCCPKLANE